MYIIVVMHLEMRGKGAAGRFHVILLWTDDISGSEFEHEQLLKGQ